MKKNSMLMFAFLIAFALGFQIASAQITINIPKIPKIPKIKKDKPEQPQPETTPANDNNQSNDNRTNNSQTSGDYDTQQKPDECQSNSIARLVTDELAKMSADIEGYTPDRDWLYSGSPTYSYLLMSVSPSAKQEWQKDFNTISSCPKIVSGFDKLAAAAAKKLPTYKADLSNYQVHNPAEEKLMRTVFKNIADYQIYSSGLIESNWLIAKNDYGLPTARYKHGAVYVKNKTSDHPYCYLTYVNVVQDYAGGGTYGASYANFIRNGLVGCPAGGK